MSLPAGWVQDLAAVEESNNVESMTPTAPH